MLGVMSFSLPPLMVMVVALLKNVARGEFMPTQHTILYNEKLYTFFVTTNTKRQLNIFYRKAFINSKSTSFVF